MVLFSHISCYLPNACMQTKQHLAISKNSIKGNFLSSIHKVYTVLSFNQPTKPLVEVLKVFWVGVSGARYQTLNPYQAPLIPIQNKTV